MPSIYATDLFCGAGGTSAGIVNACRTAGHSLNLLAVNHWPTAIATHTLNHPEVRHLCENLDGVNPRLAIPGGRLHLLAASPECTNHSRAAGGRPRNEQSRATAWHVCRWAEALDVSTILIENVREFMDWGPLGRNGKPLKRKKGKIFHAFINSLQAIGYTVEHRILTAADFGDPTTRERLFILATKARGPIAWPTPSHSRAGATLPRWRSAREIVDWDLKGQSIFRRKKPLCDNTLRRIAAGLRKFGGESAEPFLAMLYGTNKTRDLSRPAPTVTAGGNHIGLCQPFIVQPDQTGSSGCCARSIDQPAFTVVSKQNVALIQPFLTKFHGHHAGKEDGDRRNYPVTEPIPTLDTANWFALVEPFIVKYYGTGAAKDLASPLDTVTSRDRFLLVDPKSGRSVAELDILFRMLQPHELAAAQGFAKDYQFSGNREDQVKQIGNAVPVNLATALATSLLAQISG